MQFFFVFDVESIGLHGEAFAVAGGVYSDDGQVDWEFRFAAPRELAQGDDSDREWVNENVPQMTPTHPSLIEMRNAFWAEWEKAKAQGAIMAAECLWPVEGGFVQQCVRDRMSSRKWDGPYPFLEIASVLLAAGMDPMAVYERHPNELPKHDPSADARQSARLLSEALITIRELH